MSRGGLSPLGWVLAFVVFDVLVVLLVLGATSAGLGTDVIPWRAIVTFAAIGLVGGVVRLQRR